ncbi:MAG: ATP-binding cassette domain-containing protein [bacterium]|jgi:energy-coupling factor transporter ATP-binding protein EcfA2|nr:ATP-binding cassette domain-containing protein [bacterium]
MMFELDRLELGYAGRTLLRPQSRRLEPGRLLLRGASGCGKTTLLRVLAGLGRPRAGGLSWRGAPLQAGGLAAHRRRVHLVSQQPLLPGDDLEEALALGLTLRGLPTPPRSRLREELAALGLALDLDAPPAVLSGGEAMRATVLRGLLMPVDLLLLDEPTAGLDEAAARLLLDRLAAPGVPPLIVASHDPRWLAFCHRRVELRGEALHDA